VDGGHLCKDGDIKSSHRGFERSSHQVSSVNRIWAAAATTDKTVQRQRDRQVYEGVDGSHLVDDGVINIDIKTLSD
jgi:hypothetical protein